MSPKLALGRPRKNKSEAAPADTSSPIASATQQTTAGLAARAASASLVACLVLSPVGLVVGGLALLQSSAAAAPPPAAAALDRANERAVAGEFARTVVVTWLTTTREHPEQLTALVKGVNASSLPQIPFAVSDAAVAGITEVGGTTWAVTVAATVTDAHETTARRFFQVPIQVGEKGVVAALALPAAIAAPDREAATPLDYRNQIDRTSSAGQTVAQFLAAYLASQGEVSRYLTPGEVILPISPAPYAAVRLDELRASTEIPANKQPTDKASVRVLATVSATVTDTQTITVQYALTLLARDGRWEVTAIDPAPALAITPAVRTAGSATPATGRATAASSTATPTEPTPDPRSNR